jgi:hypothetical protein
VVFFLHDFAFFSKVSRSLSLVLLNLCMRTDLKQFGLRTFQSGIAVDYIVTRTTRPSRSIRFICSLVISQPFLFHGFFFQRFIPPSFSCFILLVIRVTLALETFSIFATVKGALFMTFVHNFPTLEFLRFIIWSVKIINHHVNISTN